MMTKKLSADALEFFKAMGAKGGNKSARHLTTEQRQKRARAGGLARQAKKRQIADLAKTAV